MDKDVDRIVHILADFNVHMRIVYAEMKYQRERLGWSKEDLREYCSKKYGVSTFLALSDEQISELYFYLDSLPGKTPLPYRRFTINPLTIKPLGIKTFGTYSKKKD